MHVLVPEQVFTPTPRPDLHKIYRSLGAEIAETVRSLDLRTYDAHHLLRLPYTRHGKTDRYCIPMNVRALEELTVTEIIDMSSQAKMTPANGIPASREITSVPAAVGAYRDIEIRYDTSKKRSGSPRQIDKPKRHAHQHRRAIYSFADCPCITGLHTKPLPRIGTDGRPVQRYAMAANLAATVILLGLDPGEAHGLYRAFNDLNNRPDEPEDHLHDECTNWEAAIRQRRSRGGYSHSATIYFGEMKNLGWCEPTCTMLYWCWRDRRV
jgi:hypothetical protein